MMMTLRIATPLTCSLPGADRCGRAPARRGRRRSGPATRAAVRAWRAVSSTAPVSFDSWAWAVEAHCRSVLVSLPTSRFLLRSAAGHVCAETGDVVLGRLLQRQAYLELDHELAVLVVHVVACDLDVSDRRRQRVHDLREALEVGRCSPSVIDRFERRCHGSPFVSKQASCRRRSLAIGGTAEAASVELPTARKETLGRDRETSDGKSGACESGREDHGVGRGQSEELPGERS